MELARREKKIQLLKAEVKQNKIELKQRLMKGGNSAAYHTILKSYESCLKTKSKALEHMHKLIVYLEQNSSTTRVQFAKQNIKQQIKEIIKELKQEQIGGL